jgi:hypothetical protein
LKLAGFVTGRHIIKSDETDGMGLRI